MTAEELMKPRFEVVADYPNSPYQIGDIVQADSGVSSMHIASFNYTDEFGENVVQHTHVPSSIFEQFPVLFRKLNWWEHRKEADMPKKLISRLRPDSTDVYIIVGWDMKNMLGWLNEEERECCSLTTFSPEYGYFPVD